MDMLLSLPIMGYFLPSVTSYSTSLNFLFFYMTWSTLVLSNSTIKVVWVGTLASYVVFFLLPALLFLIFDTILPSLAVGIKIQGAQALPTRTGGVRGARRRKDRLQWYRVVGLSMLNVGISVVLQAGVELFTAKFIQMGTLLKVTTTLPLPWVIGREVAQMLLMRDILQYSIHRWILHPGQKTTLSRLHQNYAHSIKASWAFASHFDHPLPHFLHHDIPLLLPTLIFRPHILTYLLQLSLTTLASTLVHSGYNAVPGILLGGATQRCDLHFSSNGRGNYSSSGILDWICGTGVGGDVMDDVKDEAEKHRVGERGGEALKGLKESGKERIRSARRKSGRRG